MSKYCPIAKQFTNCTDNCKQCLEEEEKEGKQKMIKVGTRVKYIHEDTMEDKATGFYPPIGTLGTVTYSDEECEDSIQVKWDEGTNGDQIWWCETTSVEEVA